MSEIETRHDGTDDVTYFDKLNSNKATLAEATITSATATDLTISNDLTITDAGNIILGTTTGTKIGTATGQKVGFFNATPVVQAAHIADGSDAATTQAAVNAVLVVLENLGLVASA